MAVIQPEGQLTWGGAVLPQIQTLSPRIRKAHGGHWWWWPLRDPQHRGWVERWHEEVKFRCCYLLVMCYLLFPSFLSSCYPSFKCCSPSFGAVSNCGIFPWILYDFICYGFPRAKKRAEKIGLTFTKTGQLLGKESWIMVHSKPTLTNFRGSQAVSIF